MVRWSKVSALLISVAIALSLGHGRGLARAQATDGEGSMVDPITLSALSDAIRPYCVWNEKRASDPADADPEALRKAIENSVGWVRAVVVDDHVPDDLGQRMVGIVDDIRGYDTTRVVFASETYRFLVTQTPAHIVVVARRIEDDAGASGKGRQELEMYMRAVMDHVFKHAKVIQHICRVEETSFGVRMIPREFPSKGTDPEGRAEALRGLEQEILKIDPTLPQYLGAGPLWWWWGQVQAMTDGSVVVLRTRKATGGGAMFDMVNEWFRKERLPGPDGKIRSRLAPSPPKD